MRNLRDFPLGKGVLDATGYLRVNSYGRGVITKYCKIGYASEDTDVLLEDDFSNRDYLNTWLPGNALVNYGLGRIQSEWLYIFYELGGDAWENWDISSGRFYLPHNNAVGLHFANPQERFILQPQILPTSLDLQPLSYGFPSATPQYDPTGTEIVIDAALRHFRLDIRIGWGPSTTKTIVFTPYQNSLYTLTLEIVSGTAMFGGPLEMSTGMTNYSSGIVVSFVWQTVGYDQEFSPDFNFNQLAILVDDAELTRSHCRIGVMTTPGVQGGHVPPNAVNFKHLDADLVTWEQTGQGGISSYEDFLIEVDNTGTDPSDVYLDLVTLSRESTPFEDCAINGIGSPEVTIQNSDYPATADATYTQSASGSPRGANSSALSYVGDSSLPKFIASSYVSGGVGIARPLYIYGMFVRLDEYAQPIVRITFAQSTIGASSFTVEYKIAGVYPNYSFPATLTKAKTASGAWNTLNPLGADVEFVLEFV